MVTNCNQSCCCTVYTNDTATSFTGNNICIKALTIFNIYNTNFFIFIDA